MASRDSARKFHFLREIASGGFGSVYLAKVMHADGFSRIAAVKLLHRRWSENREIAQRMRDEARLLGWLRHRNIVDVIDLTSIDGRAAVIMEYLEAVDLKTLVQSLADKGEVMPARAALELVSFVASALDAAYNRPPFQGEKPLRVIHRDIKPSNIMVDEAGQVKVLDFGVARAEFENRESHTQELQFGSVDYMPPERLFFEPETDLSDVYSLGATLYEMLAGVKLGKAKGRAEKHAVFLEDRLSFLAARNPVPPPHGEAVFGLIRSMCAYVPDQRPRATDVVTRCRALLRALDGELLTEWAEHVIPPLLRAHRDAAPEPNPLNDAVLAEDSILFSQAELASFERIQDLAGGVVVGSGDAMPAEIPRDDARWELLRQAALAEIAAGAPKEGPPPPPKVQTVSPTPTADGLGGRAPRPKAPEPRAPEPKANGALPGVVVAGESRRGPTSIEEPAGLRKARPTPADPGSSTPPAPPPAAPARPAFEEEPTRVSMPDELRRPEDTRAKGPALPITTAPSPDHVDEPPAPPPPPERTAATSVSAAGTTATDRKADRATDDEPAVTTRVQARNKVVVPPPPPVPARKASPPATVAEPFPESAPEPKGRAGLWLVAAVVGMGLAAGVCAGLGWVGWRMYAGSPAAPAPAAATEPKAEAAPAAVAAPVDLGPDAIRFVSEATDTSKIMVSCGGKDYAGAAEVQVPGPDAGECAVRVILKDRSRLNAKVASATKGTWRCFSGGAKECVR